MHKEGGRVGSSNKIMLTPAHNFFWASRHSSTALALAFSASFCSRSYCWTICAASTALLPTMRRVRVPTPSLRRAK
eukprot:scaffold16485_cov140-Isochrysis_galbana.AAC.6